MTDCVDGTSGLKAGSERPLAGVVGQKMERVYFSYQARSARSEIQVYYIPPRQPFKGTCETLSGVRLVRQARWSGTRYKLLKAVHDEKQARIRVGTVACIGRCYGSDYASIWPWHDD